jgi:glycosyltransferase involved in cell wall biosynthesis
LSFTQVDALVLVSRWQGLYAQTRCYQPPDRLLMIETPLPSGFHGLNHDLHRPATLGYCGAWLRSKGVAVLQQTLVALLRQHPACEVRLVGVGAAFRKEDMFPPDVAPRIRVEPFLADKRELMAWYAEIAVLLMPSYSESFGLVVTEAMACGCAVVASKTGYAATLLGHEEAMIVDSHEASGYIAAAGALLRDDALRRRIAARGRQRVQALRWHEAGVALDALYRSLSAAKSNAVMQAEL